MKTTNLYDIVTGNIIAELQMGAIPWLKPWKGGGTGHLPANAISRRSYSGINIVLLWYEADIHSYPTHLWLTYRQAKAQGATVRKGERGTHIVFTKPLLVKDKEKEDPKTIQMLKTFCVFNIVQIDGLSCTSPSRKNGPNLSGMKRRRLSSKQPTRISGWEATRPATSPRSITF